MSLRATGFLYLSLCFVPISFRTGEGIREPAAITITPQAAAHAALSHLGRCVTSHGHWRHAMLAALFSILPSGRRNRIFLANALEMGEAERAKGN